MVRADVSNPDDVKALLSQTEEELGPITDLVNSAALATGIGPIEDLDIEQTRRMLEINVFGLFICCHCAVRRMARRRGGQGGLSQVDEDRPGRTDRGGREVPRGLRDQAGGDGQGDLDGDGRADLVILRGFSVNTPYPAGLDIYLQQEGGKFRAQRSEFDFGEDYPRSVVLDDLDGDGDLDMLVSASQQVRIWENSSDKPSSAPVVPASDTQGYLSQVVTSKPLISVQAPLHIRPAAPEDFNGR